METAATPDIGDVNLAGESQEAVVVKSDWSKAAAAAPPVPAPKEAAPVAASGAMTTTEKEVSKPAAHPTAALSNSKADDPSLPPSAPSLPTPPVT